ncbi:hypothetical protein Rsub_06860 [Raphidocelis subcapitata]|uniref:Protein DETOXIFICATION n=1 Tax=Raphidocelis subcapitata TaxID=307507 RepID=A0A2V0P1V4_9CHLO|nr:hypothetical protein Rsub_06860 [Raphidocelis subcapitata]|eukprot:GBF93861.1 hypothetical protein Rsub_06860 [Raphidocelis subcapitata]
MLSFLGPALIIPLGEPLMNVVDTVCLGQWAGTAELAAMGPATILFAFAQYVFQALQISTVTLISEDLRLGQRLDAQRTLACALTLAVAAGTVVALLLELFAEPIIAATGANPALSAAACAYIRVRAVAQPAVLATMVLQAALLAQQDSATPAVATALAVTVSLIGNIVAVGVLGMGIIGAAATTVATQLVAAGALAWLAATREGRLRPALTVPLRADLLSFARTMGPLAITYICKNTCYLVLQTAAAGLDTLRLAAHQAVFSYWNLLAFTTAPLEQISLAFIPAAAPGWRRRETITFILRLGALVGVTAGLLAAALPLGAPQLLTRDAAVWPHMAAVAPLALGAMLLTAADVASTGALLAVRDLRYVAQAFVVTLCGLAAFMGSQPSPRTLENIWHGCIFFFGARLVQSGSRLAWLWRQGRLDAAAPGEDSGGEGGEGGEEGEEGEGKGGDAAAAAAEGDGVPPAGDGDGRARRRRGGAAAGSPDPSGGQLELSP